MSLIEATISTLIVGLVVVGSMESLGALLQHRRFTSDRNRAALLAEDLMSEILENDYADPEQPNQGIQIDSNENSYPRTDYDDVDDFHNWDAAPPQDRDGTVLAGLQSWRRTVTVEYVDPADLTTTIAVDLGVKRITVTVYENGQKMVSATTIRTSAGKDVQ